LLAHAIGPAKAGIEFGDAQKTNTAQWIELRFDNKSPKIFNKLLHGFWYILTILIYGLFTFVMFKQEAEK
jgi:hypothetical protein